MSESPEIVAARFVRKPADLAEVRAATAGGLTDTGSAVVRETVPLTAAEFDAFAAAFLHDRPWLAGRGGWVDPATRSVVRVVAAGRPTLLVDPSGYGYARYVAVATPEDAGLLVPKGVPLQPGRLYLHLSHGRTDPAEQLNDWGFPDPTFGPLARVQQTDAAAGRLFGHDNAELWLSVCDDLVVWDGAYFGDVAVFVADDGDTA
jgi:hypothetical protein